MSSEIENGTMSLAFVFLNDQLSQRVAELVEGETPQRKLDVTNFEWAIATLRQRLDGRKK